MTAHSLQQTVDQFLAHKRALGRKYHSEERELRLLVAFATERDALRLVDLTPALLEQFLDSRARAQPRSFNHLRGAVSRLLDWAVTQQLIAASPLRTRHRRTTSQRIPFLFDPIQARRLLDAAGALPALQRGPTYQTMFALCYGLGLRAGEVCGLRLEDVDTARALLIVRGGKFGKSRLVPHGPRIAALLAAQIQRRRDNDAIDAQQPLFAFVGSRAVHPCTASQVFHRLVMALELPVGDGVAPPTLHSLRHSFAVGCLCAGIAKDSIPPAGCISSQRSWGTPTWPRPRSI